MSASCCDHAPDPHLGNEGYRRVLWAVLAINATMFAVEVAAGLVAGSAALQADALDFLGDTANYAISLFVVGMALRYRAMAAFLKGATMGVFGLWVLGVTAWHVWHGSGSDYGGPRLARCLGCSQTVAGRTEHFARATPAK
ncbi:MAG: cation transporter [Methyloceanibacter sp.]